MIRLNPAASYDLGYFAAAADLDSEDLSRITDVYHDRATMDYAAARFEREYDAYVEAQIARQMEAAP